MNPITPDPFRGVGGAFVRDAQTGRRRPADDAPHAPAAAAAAPVSPSPAPDPVATPFTVPAVPADDDPEF